MKLAHLRVLALLQKRKQYYGRNNMYQYKFSDEDTQKITDKTIDIQKLYDNLDKIDKKYNLRDEVEATTDTLGLQKKEFTKPTDEQIETQAKNSLSEYKQTSLNKIQNDYDSNAKAIEQDLKDLSNTKKNQQDTLQVAYNNAKTDAENDAIKRGLARSSIIVNTLAQYDNSMLAEFANIEKTYSENVTKLNNQKSQLEVQKQNALDSFDIAYAVKLSDKIDQINNELSEKANEVLEYNNKIAQLEKEYLQQQQEDANTQNNKIADDNLKLLEFYNKYGKDYTKLLKEDEKLKVVEDFIENLTWQEAYDLLENDKKILSQFSDKNLKTLSEFIAGLKNKQ